MICVPSVFYALAFDGIKVFDCIQYFASPECNNLFPDELKFQACFLLNSASTGGPSESNDEKLRKLFNFLLIFVLLVGQRLL